MDEQLFETAATETNGSPEPTEQPQTEAHEPVMSEPVTPEAAEAQPAEVRPQAAPYMTAQPQYQYNPYMGQPAGYMPMYAPRPKPVRRKGTTRDVVMAILTGVMCFIMTDCFIWTGRLGMGFTIGAVLFLAAEVWYIAPVIKKKSIYGAACILLYIAGCVSLVFSADGLLKFLTLLCLMMLTSCLLMESMELRVWEPGSLSSVGDYFYTAYAATFGKIASGMYGLFCHEKKEDSKRKKSVGKALLGLAIALPLILLSGFLLYCGDDAFRGMLNGIDFDKAPEKLLSIALAIPVFILLFSRLFSLRDIKRERCEEKGKGLDPVVLTFFLLGISLVYLLYLFSQLAYFFNGFMGFLPEDFTYAEYARRGFFELTAVSFINIVTVMLCTAFCRKKEGKLPVSVKLMLMFLCVFSLVIAFTEVAKMKMYMDAFGLTRLRILTTVFTVFLALVFVTLIMRLFIKKTPYMKIAAVIGAAMVIALNFINIDGVIARYNVQAYRDETLKTIDVRTITSLNDAAVPSLIELAEDEKLSISTKAADSLYLRWRNLHENDDDIWDILLWGGYGSDSEVGELKDYDWRGFDLTSYQARELILENEEMILSKRSSSAYW